jgi:hypothetical protein
MNRLSQIVDRIYRIDKIILQALNKAAKKQLTLAKESLKHTEPFAVANGSQHSAQQEPLKP